ncbi:GvpL/GvpF family gas vesicle protein [Streptomyces sp. NPDC058664]|uniref:GvpL/GvpF family gas vesicle protein n=1 Tax=unclassified Streptomyces TaxID=2593676 RepID=UPI003650922C
MNTDTGRESLTYVYAVARPTERLGELLTGLRGVDRAPVTLLRAPAATSGSDAATSGSDAGVSGSDASPAPSDPPPAALAFVVSPVPHSDFDEAGLKEHFEDLRWLEDVARAHHEVVQAVAVHTAVLPLRMATVYQDDARARQALVRRHDAFARRLAELDGHTEYGVKIHLPAPTSPGADAPPAGAAAPTTPGKAYLRRRKAQHHAREQVYQEAQRAARTVEAIGVHYASERVRHAPQSGELAGPLENVLNDAYLVPDRYAREFRTAIEQAAREFPGVPIEVTGPWAPYSFAVPPAQDPSPGDGGERMP